MWDPETHLWPPSWLSHLHPGWMVLSFWLGRTLNFLWCFEIRKVDAGRKKKERVLTSFLADVSASSLEERSMVIAFNSVTRRALGKESLERLFEMKRGRRRGNWQRKEEGGRRKKWAAHRPNRTLKSIYIKDAWILKQSKHHAKEIRWVWVMSTWLFHPFLVESWAFSPLFGSHGHFCPFFQWARLTRLAFFFN